MSSRRREKNSKPIFRYATVSALAVAAIAVAGFAITGERTAPAPTIDMAKADQAIKEAAASRSAKAAAELEAVTVPLNFPTGGKPLRVLYTGDSIAEGFYSTTEDQAFRRLVTSGLRESGPVQDFGTFKAGSTVQYITDNFTVPKDIDLAVISLGTNDSRTEGDAPGFGKRYGAYISSIKALSPNAEILCLGIWAPTNTRTMPYLAEISSQCEAKGGRFVDIGASYASSVLSGPAGVKTWAGTSDAAHPNDLGHKAIANEVLERIRR